MHFDNFCTQHGIVYKIMKTYLAKSNTDVEDKNRTMKDMMNMMLINLTFPQNIAGEAILTNDYFLNKVPRKKLDSKFYESWKDMRPYYQYLKV